eukprot:TRINITY_DN42711_c0_g1_i1.p1 TRINITY_DN42711_c0_g1~~TRINITY_DN42711_c0_g1_i1.p1  ORF type:complete len:163 (+),score=16.62 TRINITY_DN42711_c0_g1_i1:91-579(+)
MSGWHSRLETAVQPRVEDDFAFGHFAPSRCWQRGVGGGFHDPSAHRKFGASMDFNQWMEKWTTPAPPNSTVHRMRYDQLPAQSPLQSVPALNLGQTQRQSSSSRPPTGGSEAQMQEAMGATSSSAAFRATPKTPMYPNPTNWKHKTSLPTRCPGYVGSLRTR